MATTATATLDATRVEADQHDKKIEQLKSDIQEAEAEANLLLVQERKATAADLPKILRRKEIVESNLRRDRAQFIEQQDISAKLWGTIREAEQAERIRARTAEPEQLKAEILRAVSDYRNGLSALVPQTTRIQSGIRRLQQLTNTAQINVFPYPPEALAAQAAMREVSEALRGLRETFESTIK